MEATISEIIKILIGANLTFIGLIFTSLGIILSIKNDNWKIKHLKKSSVFDKFVRNNICCVKITIVLLLLSVFIILLGNASYKIFFWAFCLVYTILLLLLCCLVLSVANKYYKLIKLINDDNEPILSIDSRNDD